MRASRLALACLLVASDAGAQVDDPAAPVAIEVAVPSQVSLEEIAVAASGEILVGARSHLEGRLTGISGAITVGVAARVGAITTGGAVGLRNFASVDGDVTAGGPVDASAKSTVSGTLQQNATLPDPQIVHWEAEAPAMPAAAIELVPGELRNLEPGAYGAVTLPPRSRVVLHSGVYVLTSLAVLPDAELIVEDADGPVQVYVAGPFSFHGTIRSAYPLVPQLLIAVRGAHPVLIGTAFTGVLVAPSSEVRVKSGAPDGHRALFYGRSVHVDPDTSIRVHPFDWVEVAGAGADPGVEGEAPLHAMPSSPADMTVAVAGDGTGSSSASRDPGGSIRFTLPEAYPTAGGVIANGTATLTFTSPDGAVVTCVYRGGSSTAQPVDAEELTLGRILHFEGCSDGLPADARREGVRFDLSVQPALGYPVSVRSPITADGRCSDEMELLSAVRTRSMRAGFSWSNASRVASTNTDGSHALYYAWVYVRDYAEEEALRKLYIHVLRRPLFTEELEAHAGKCGLFTNPGDGQGVFVPVVIPGRTYNRLIDALSNDEIQGDRVVFDAVILRSVPLAARNPNGSLRLDVLAQSGFRYLHYEPHPLPGSEHLDLAGGAAKTFVDALTWVAEGAQDVAEAVTNTLGALDRLIRDEVTLTLNLHAITGDPSFGPGDPIMIRGWGRYANQALGARGLEVTVLQKLFDLPFPSTSQGRTSSAGRAVIDAVRDGENFGSGLCIELKSDAARVTDFLVANELCDLRGFDPSRSTAVDDYELDDFSASREIDVHVANVRLVGLYQADDAYRHSRAVMGFRPRRARILSGYWAETFSPTRDDGSKRLWTPCLGFSNSVSDLAIGLSVTAGILAAAVIPTPVIPIAAGVFAAVIVDTDVVMSTNSNLVRSREVMSHEYGHYLFCAQLQRFNRFAVDHLTWTIIASGDDLTGATRYLNEAFAEFTTGQVAGGADYGWLDATTGGFCDGRVDAAGEHEPCWDANERSEGATAEDTEDMARIATLIHDAFDGHDADRRLFVPGDGDVWVKRSGLCAEADVPFDCCVGAGQGDGTPECEALVYSSAGYGDNDSHLERVALSGTAFATFAEGIASKLAAYTLGTDIDDEKIFESLDEAMQQEGENWCERCRVMALHSTTAPGDAVGELFRACVDDPLVAGAVGAPPEPDLRLDAESCTACPSLEVSNADGVCEPCPLGQAPVGNRCEGVVNPD